MMKLPRPLEVNLERPHAGKQGHTDPLRNQTISSIPDRT
jgi:hypothetical protein